MQRIALARVTLPTISKMTTVSSPADCPVLVQPAQPDSLDALDLDSSSAPVPTLDSLITATTPSEPAAATTSPTFSTTQFDVSEQRIPFNPPRPFNPATNPNGPFLNTLSSSVSTQPSIILSLDDFELAGLMESEDYDNDGDYYDSDENGYDSETRRRRRRQRQQRRPGRPTRSSSDRRTRQLEARVPVIPDMRFEQQLLKNIAAQVAQNRSSQHIFWTTIVRDQIAMPFLNGFAWKFGGLWWAWMRLRRQGSPEGRHFWRDVWTKMNAYLSNIYVSAIQLPVLLVHHKEPDA